MPKFCTCDICGVGDAIEDYNGRILCATHRAEDTLKNEIAEYKELRQWVHRVWVSQLRDRRKKIVELRQRIGAR